MAIEMVTGREAQMEIVMVILTLSELETRMEADLVSLRATSMKL